MNLRPRLLLSASAVAMFVAGLGACFAPDWLLLHFRADPTHSLQLVVQVMGALYLGFAALNWMTRGFLVGGIYGRPVAIANLMHFTIVSFALIKLLVSGVTPPVLVAITALYAVFAVWFGLVAFGGGVHGRK